MLDNIYDKGNMVRILDLRPFVITGGGIHSPFSLEMLHQSAYPKYLLPPSLPPCIHCPLSVLLISHLLNPTLGSHHSISKYLTNISV